jgi:formate hydrogenlyase transcriptional activator
MNSIRASAPAHDRLLEVLDAILSAGEFESALRQFPQQLSRLLSFDSLHLAIQDPGSSRWRYGACVPTLSAAACACELTLSETGDEPACGGESALLRTLPPSAMNLPQAVAPQGSHLAASVQTGTLWLGELTVCNSQQEFYSAADQRLLQSVATHLAFSYERTLEARRHADKCDRLFSEHDRLLVVRAVSEAVVSELSLNRLLSLVSLAIHQIAGTDYADVLLYDPVHDRMRRPASCFTSGEVEVAGYLDLYFGRSEEGAQQRPKEREDHLQVMDNSPALVAFRRRLPYVARESNVREEARHNQQIARFIEAGIREWCCIPLIARGKTLGTLNVGSMVCARFTTEVVEMLEEISKPIAVAVENALSFEEINGLKERLAHEKAYLESEIWSSSAPCRRATASSRPTDQRTSTRSRRCSATSCASRATCRQPRRPLARRMRCTTTAPN